MWLILIYLIIEVDQCCLKVLKYYLAAFKSIRGKFFIGYFRVLDLYRINFYINTKLPYRCNGQRLIFGFLKCHPFIPKRIYLRRCDLYFRGNKYAITKVIILQA